MARSGVAGAPLRILAVAPTASVSGAERVLVRYLAAAAERGHRVSALAPSGACADLLRAAGIPVVALPELALPPGRRPVALARVASRWPRAARALRRAAQDADVVLVNGFLALPVVRLARPVDTRVAWLVHDVVRRRAWLALLLACAPAIDRALAVSAAVAAPPAALGIPTTIVRNGTPWPVARAAAPDPADVPVIGVNAMLTAWKGQDVLLEAVRRLDRPVRVELMGGHFPRDAAYVDRLTALAAAPDLAGRVGFLGHVADPVARLRTWSVAVSSSVDPEAAPLNVLEAMSVGVPMVATDHGGTPEVLGDAGLLVPPRDVAAMAHALERLLDDRALHARCAAAGPAVVAAGLRLDDAHDAVLAALADVVSRPAAPAGPPAPRPVPRPAVETR